MSLPGTVIGSTCRVVQSTPKALSLHLVSSLPEPSGVSNASLLASTAVTGTASAGGWSGNLLPLHIPVRFSCAAIGRTTRTHGTTRNRIALFMVPSAQVGTMLSVTLSSLHPPFIHNQE